MKQYKVDVVVSDDKLTIKGLKVKLKSMGEEIVWSCSGAKLTALFTKDGTPFKSAQFHGADGSSVPSDECANIMNRTYLYTIVLERKGLSKITIDPEVVIDDSVPPSKPGSSGRGTAGAGASSSRSRGTAGAGGAARTTSLKPRRKPKRS